MRSWMHGDEVNSEVRSGGDGLRDYFNEVTLGKGGFGVF